jgi:hypothetical protein
MIASLIFIFVLVCLSIVGGYTTIEYLANLITYYKIRLTK